MLSVRNRFLILFYYFALSAAILLNIFQKNNIFSGNLIFISDKVFFHKNHFTFSFRVIFNNESSSPLNCLSFRLTIQINNVHPFSAPSVTKLTRIKNGSNEDQKRTSLLPFNSSYLLIKSRRIFTKR